MAKHGLLLLAGAACACLLLIATPCSSKEIELTNEWQVVGSNDTIPAGAHVRMDMTTGEKMAKLVDKEEYDTVTDSVEIDENGGVTAISTAAVGVESTNDNEKEDKDITNSNYDYDMMHRTLSNLPPDEQERMGGIPALPGASGRTVTPEEREVFQQQMAEIWHRRQAELAAIQEELLADLPQVLKERIGWIQRYLDNPYPELVKLSQTSGGNDGSEEIEGDEGTITDIRAALLDLEYQLSDIDMARDFHTLGGWPLLVSLLHDQSHACNETLSDAINEAILVVQAHAAWVVGTTVKNTGEFFPFATEPLNVAGVTTNALELLLQQLKATNCEQWNGKALQKRQKVLYALGALLRGNRDAQKWFLVLQGPPVLVEGLEDSCRSSPKVAKKVLALASDIVSDMALHDGDKSVANALVESFSSNSICHTMVRCLESNNIKETAIRTLHVLTPHCNNFNENTVALLQRTKDWWRQSDIDPEVVRELVDLTTKTQEAIKREVDAN